MSSNEIVAVLRQALEALEYPLNTRYEVFDVDMAELLAHRAITSLRQAIATAVAEPHKESSATQEPKREPLTDKELDDICLKSKSFQHGMRLVEAAHGIIHNYPEKDNS